MSFKMPATILIAAFFGIAAALLCGRFFAMRSLNSAHDEIEKVSVLVAKRAIYTGEIIKLPKDLFEEKSFVRGEEPRDAISSFDELKGRIVKRSLRQDDFIRAEDFIGESEPVGISSQLPDVLRAFRVRVDPSSIGERAAQLPHLKVDIEHIVCRTDGIVRKIPVSDALVLAVDAKECADRRGQVVTFALSPEDILRVVLAKEIGRFRIVQRGVAAPEPTCDGVDIPSPSAELPPLRIVPND